MTLNRPEFKSNFTNRRGSTSGCGTSVDLRGLGAGATLVLLNGRRIGPSGITAGFTNIHSIPVTAIERVEVVTDGASAVYGADAIAGVVNFILRGDYEGAETRLRYGSYAGSDTSDIQFRQTLGAFWNSGNVLPSYEYLVKTIGVPPQLVDLRADLLEAATADLEHL